jgi:uncharacterized protein
MWRNWRYSVRRRRTSSNRSDLDFLVVFDDFVGRERFDAFFGLWEELENLFGRPVDLVEPEGLRNPYFIQTVNQTRRSLYAAP